MSITYNPDLCTFERNVTGSLPSSGVPLNGIRYTVSFETSSSAGGYCCTHAKPRSVWSEGFKIISFKDPNIVEIQFYDKHFDTTTDALGATWAGRSILFRHGHWIRLLSTCTSWFKQNNKPFGLRKTGMEYLLGGTCCAHSTPSSNAELEEC